MEDKIKCYKTCSNVLIGGCLFNGLLVYSHFQQFFSYIMTNKLRKVVTVIMN